MMNWINRIFRKDRVIVGGVLLIGLILTAGLLYGTSREMAYQERNLFYKESEHIRDSVSDQLRNADESLQNIAALFTVSSTEVDSDGFRLIAETTLAQQSAVRCLSFSRWVPASLKPSFEERNWRASGVADFHIHSFKEGAADADFYLPVVFLEPLTPKSISYLGLDLWSDPELKKDLQRAVESGDTVPSRAHLFGDSTSFALSKAVYSGKVHPDTVEQRGKSILGVLRIVLDSEQLMAHLRNYDKSYMRLSTENATTVAEMNQPFKKATAADILFQQDVPLRLSGMAYNLHIEKIVPFTAARAGIFLMVFLLGLSVSSLIAYRIAAFLETQREILNRQSEVEGKVLEKTRALQQSELLLRQVIDSNPNVIFAQTKDGKILFANQTFFQTFHKTKEEVYSRPLNFALPGQKPGVYEEQIQIADGELKWFETHCQDIELESYGLCILVVAVDISQKKADEAVIADQRAKMFSSAKLSALGEMAGGIAHEINTPLTTIQLHSELIWDILKEAQPNLQSIGRHTMSIASTTGRIAKIVSGLRNFSRDGSQDKMARFCLVRAIDNTLALCREKFRNSGVTLDWKAPQSLEIVGREVQISQVILNLLNNAFDAVRDTPKAWIRIYVSKTDEMVTIAVEDNGSGISEAARERLFQPFFTTKGMGQGTGLGLSISKGIIESHQGRLLLDTSVTYTRFLIELPVFTEPQIQLNQEI